MARTYLSTWHKIASQLAVAFSQVILSIKRRGAAVYKVLTTEI